MDNYILFSSLPVFSRQILVPHWAHIIKSTTYVKIDMFLSVAKNRQILKLLIGPKHTGKLLIVKGENRVLSQRY